MSKCKCDPKKKFYSVLEDLSDRMLGGDVDNLDGGDIEAEIKDIESDHDDFDDKLADLKESQSTLILICSSLIIALYDKDIIDRNAMRQLMLDTDRIQSDGLDFKGSMEYLKDLLTGKLVPSVHGVSPDDDTHPGVQPDIKK
jgi:hypothetical protein